MANTGGKVRILKRTWPMAEQCAEATTEHDALRQQTQGLWLSAGEHASLADGCSVLECVAFVSDLEHSNYPTSACPVISEIVRAMGDQASDEDRQELVPYILRLSRSTSTGSLALSRLFYSVDFIARSMVSDALAFCGVADEDVERLRQMEYVTDVKSAEVARLIIRTLFVKTFVSPTMWKVSHLLGQLEEAASAAAQVMLPRGEALAVTGHLANVMRRLGKITPNTQDVSVFDKKLVMLAHLLRIGPEAPLSGAEVLRRQRRLAELPDDMARGRATSGLKD